jgi:2-phosphosulfolactate phosphatase
MHERGIDHAWIAETLDDARRLKASHGEALLCGEQRGLRPPDFLHGNSPSEFASLELHGMSAILATSNGTPLLRHHAGADVLLIGCLRNARAVADAAAGPDRPVLIACAGKAGDGEPMIEDTFTAGAIVNHLIRINDGFELADGAQEAFETFLAHDGDATKAFGESRHARYLSSVGFDDDLAFCAAVDVSTAVPMAEQVHGELRTLLLRA